MSIFLVIEDIGFYSENQWPKYISLDELNYRTHSMVHGAFVDRMQAESVMRTIAEQEAQEWEMESPENRSFRACGSDEMINGLYVLGSFYYIEEVTISEKEGRNERAL